VVLNRFPESQSVEAALGLAATEMEGEVGPKSARLTAEALELFAGCLADELEVEVEADKGAEGKQQDKREEKHTHRERRIESNVPDTSTVTFVPRILHNSIHSLDAEDEDIGTKRQNRDDEHKEVAIISPADTIANPSTMMIEVLNAVVTNAAVCALGRPVDLASATES